MTWIDVITTAAFLLLCAIAYGVYRVKQAIEDMYSGLGELLGQHRDITKKILFQLDSGDTVPAASPRSPLHVEVHTIREDLRDFKHKWYELHIPEFAKRKAEERLEEHERIMEEHKKRGTFREYKREGQEQEPKTRNASENGDT